MPEQFVTVTYRSDDGRPRVERVVARPRLMDACRVVHSQSKAAWNVVGTIPGGHCKLARFPYVAQTGSEIADTREKAGALERAQFFARCVNSQELIEKAMGWRPVGIT